MCPVCSKCQACLPLLLCALALSVFPLLFKDTAVLFISLIPVPLSSQCHPGANHRLLQLNTIQNSQIQVAPGNLWGLTTKFIQTRSSCARLLGSEISMQTLSEEHLHCFLTQSFAFGFLLYSFRASFFAVNCQRGEPGVWSHQCLTSKLFHWRPVAHLLWSIAAKLLGFTMRITKCPFFWYQYLIFNDIIFLVMYIWGLEGPGQGGQVNNIKARYIHME